MEDLKTVLCKTRNLIKSVENQGPKPLNMKFIHTLTHDIKLFMSNFEKEHDFLDKNVELEILSGRCVKLLMQVASEVSQPIIKS